MPTVLVTGADHGIGHGLIKEFLKDGDVDTLIATASNPSTCKELQEISDARLHLIELDISSDASITAAADKVSSIVGEFGVEVLVNNTGILTHYPVDGPIDRETLTRQFDINSIGPLIIFQAFLPQLRMAAAAAGQAKVINMSSSLGSCHNSIGSTERHWIAYSMSKSAVNQLTKSLSIDFAAENIYVYAFCPGWVHIEMGTHDAHDAMLSVAHTSSRLVGAFSRLTKEHTGGFFNHEFHPIPY